MKTLIHNGVVFTGTELLAGHSVLLEGGKIASILRPADPHPAVDRRVDLKGGSLLPGFIDLQVNGGGGVLFNDALDADGILAIGEAHRRFGTTGFLATLVSADRETMRQAISAVARAMEDGLPGLLGIHLEGPLLNPARCGIHDATRFAALDDEMLALLSSLPSGITLVTLAPECCRPGDISLLAQRGIIVAAGHTEATYEQICRAQEAGLSGFTHLFNAMPPFTSREPGPVGAALAGEQGWFGIIADGHHVHPASMRIAVRARAPGAALLVTDAMPTVGADIRSFRLSGQEIHLTAGRLENRRGTLAGSHLDMLTAVNNAAEFAAIDWYEAVRMASLYPARALGLERELGSVKPGYRANLLALDAQRRLVGSWIDGEYRDNSDYN